MKIEKQTRAKYVRINRENMKDITYVRERLYKINCVH